MSKIDFKLPTSDEKRKAACLGWVYLVAASLSVAYAGYALDNLLISAFAVGMTNSTGKIMDSYVQSIRNLQGIENQSGRQPPSL